MKFLSVILMGYFFSYTLASAFAFETQNNKSPLEIQAQKGMICSQDKKCCTAFGPVVSTQGTSVLKSSKLVVYFKNMPSSSPKEKKMAPSPTSPQQDIEKIEAFGNVHFFDTQEAQQGSVEATGDYALYKATEGILILKGHPLLKDGKTTLLGATQVIFYEKAQKAKTVGRSVIKRDGKLMQADVFHVYFTRDSKGKLAFDRAEAHGNVMISTSTEIAKAKRGVYAHNTQMAELFEDVVITRADGQLRGNYGRYDMTSGQSQLFQKHGHHNHAKQVQAILSPKALRRTKVTKKTT